MNFEFVLTQIMLGTVAATSSGIALDFYKSKDGRLRILMIRLFSAKSFVYGGAMLYYWFVPPISFVYVRFALLFPMFIVMLQLWGFIREKRK